MKHMRLTFLLLLLFVPSAWAAEHEESSEQKTGFSADLVLGGGWIMGKGSGLDTDPARIRIRTWDEGRKKFTTRFLMASADLRYTFATGTTLIAGNGADTQSAPVTIGLSQAIQGIGVFGLQGATGSEDVWQNPYLLDSDRIKTRKRTGTLGFFVEDILGTGAELRYTGAWSRVKDDRSGMEEKDLMRRGITHSLSLSFGLPLNDKNIFSPTLVCERGDFKGKSNSYTALGGNLAYTRLLEKCVLTVSFGGLVRDFEKSHPVFGKTRKETESNLGISLTIPGLFGREELALLLMAAHSSTHATPDFFQSHSRLAGAGLRYSF